jgi:hypothetical protein
MLKFVRVRGSAIAKIVAENTKANPEVFEPEVNMCAPIRLTFERAKSLTWYQVGL